MKKILFAVILMALILGFSSCDKEKNPESEIDRSDLIGSWELIHEYMWEKENGVLLYEDDTDEFGDPGEGWIPVMTFNDDGTGIDPEDEPFTWELSGTKLLLVGTGYDMTDEWTGTSDATIEELTSTRLVYSFQGLYTEDEQPHEGYIRQTYTKR